MSVVRPSDATLPKYGPPAGLWSGIQIGGGRQPARPFERRERDVEQDDLNRAVSETTGDLYALALALARPCDHLLGRHERERGCLILPG